MTRERNPFYQCRGKFKHPSREAAKAARADMASHPGREHLIAVLTPYECPHCHSFHLGTARDDIRRLKRFNKRAEKQRRKQLIADLTPQPEGETND